MAIACCGTDGKCGFQAVTMWPLSQLRCIPLQHPILLLEHGEDALQAVEDLPAVGLCRHHTDLCLSYAFAL